MQITAQTSEREVRKVTADLPDKCPICHKGIQARLIMAFLNPDKWDDSDCLQVICKCPLKACSNLFIAYYYSGSSELKYFKLMHCRPSAKMVKEFPKTIKNISPEFCEIYHQALIAEENGLAKICGPGYRKALEFLIKDYLIAIKPQKKNEILEKLLGKCIEDDLDNSRIKETARRATWLGNDETHYLKKWIDKDLDALKQLIALTMHWIEMEDHYQQALQSMPEKKF